MTEYGGGYDTHRPEIPSSAGWATFEARVRGRRFARCVERAHAAIDSGDLDGARAAVSEAQALMPDAPEIDELQVRIASRPTGVDIPTFVEMPPMEADPGWPRVIGAMAVLLLLFGLFGFGLAQLYFTHPAQQLLSAGSSPVDNELAAVKDKPMLQPGERPQAELPQTKPALPASPAATTGMTEPLAPTPAPQPPAESRRVIPTQEAAPRPTPQTRLDNARSETRSEMRRPPARPGPSAITRSAGTTRPEAEPPSLAPPAPPPSNRPAERPTATAPTTDNPPAPVASLPASPAPAPTPAVAETSSPPIKPADTPVPASRETPSAGSRAEESARIRSVLTRYESAYNRLDATAASSIWPTVDEGALDRAFKGLLSQRVSLGVCDITVIGDIGGASCAGKARWEPRVGGGAQTADRHWTFNLRKSGDNWKIERIRVR
jgi:hypothetical protein